MYITGIFRNFGNEKKPKENWKFSPHNWLDQNVQALKYKYGIVARCHSIRCHDIKRFTNRASSYSGIDSEGNVLAVFAYTSISSLFEGGVIC